MKDINYAYFSGALESILMSLPHDSTYESLTKREQVEYVRNLVKKAEARAIEYNNPL